MREYEVKVPIAGHAVITVEAESEEAAIEAAIGDIQLSDIDCFEAIKQFNRGNVCFCPQPWSAEVWLLDE